MERKSVQAGSPGAGFPDRNGGVKIADHFADGGCHVVRGRVGESGRVRTRSDVFVVASLRDREERRGFRIFTERKVFSISDDAHDLDRHAGAVLEVAADGVGDVSVSEWKRRRTNLLIHNGNRRRLRGVGEAYIASRQQWGCRGGEISRRDVVVEGIKCCVRGPEIDSLLREDAESAVSRERGVVFA